MKRFSVYFLFGLSVLSAFILFDYSANRTDWLNWYRNDFAHRADRLNDETYVAHSYYVATKDLDALSDLLEARRRMGAINFWLVTDGASMPKSSLTPEEAAAYKFDLTRDGSGEVLTDRDRHYAFFYAVERLDSNPPLKLVMGVRRAEKEFLAREFDLQKFFLIRYVVGIAAIAIALFAFFFRDVMHSIQWLVRGRPGDMKLSAHSREMAWLNDGLQGVDTLARGLKSDAATLALHVRASLRSELASGLTPPYEFGCTLARLDLNHFSTIYAQHPPAMIAELLNEFFLEASHVIERHGGFVHEFIGDEVIFYFKDGESPDSIAMTVTALFAINRVAERFHERTMKAHGFPFTIKSAFANGTLRFGPFVGGFNLTGGTLIETVRLLSHVNDRDGNQIVFAERHADAAAPFAQVEFVEEVKLKGLPRPVRMWRARDRQALMPAWSSGQVERLTFYRDDDDLMNLIRLARAEGATESKVNQVIEQLRSLPGGPFTAGVMRQVLDWMHELAVLSASSETRERAQMRILASLVRVAARAPHEAAIREETIALLVEALELRDARVAANALETLMQLAPEPDLLTRLEVDPQRWTKDARPRVAMNAAVWLATQAFDARLARRFKKGLKSSQSPARASAVFAIGEIARAYRARDLAQYRAQGALLELVEQLPELCLDRDESVSRQALRAILKIGDVALSDQALLLANEASEFERVRVHQALLPKSQRAA